MALQDNGRAPYATTKTIVRVLAKHRDVQFSKVDGPLLLRIGVQESLVPRTLVSLNLLGFTGVDGASTPEFTRLHAVSDDDYKQALAEMLRVAYAPVLAVIGDPSTVGPSAIDSAFRGFQPTGQRDRMVQLFIGLMQYADMMPEQPSARRLPTRRLASTPVPRPTLKRKTVQPIDSIDLEPAVTATGFTDTPQQAASEYSRSVHLLGGAGSVTIQGDLNPFSLSGATREFFFKLVDLLDEYDHLACPERPVQEKLTETEEPV